MRGSYQLREWEHNHLKKIVNEAIKFCEINIGKKYDFTRLDICPANIETILISHLGFKAYDIDWNNMDVSIVYNHPSWHDNKRLHVCVNADSLELFMIIEEE